MQIALEGTTVWMTVSNIDLDLARGIPHRAYDTKRQQWRAPITPRVVSYLNRILNQDQRWELEKAQIAFVPHALPNYPFKTEPRNYQLAHLEAMQDMPAYAILFEPGLGKSKVFIDDTMIARGRGIIDAAAVVCPNSIKSNWVDEIEKHSPEEADVFVYDPSKKKQAARWISDNSGPRCKWFVIAVESLSSGEGRKFLESFLKAQRTSLAVDESSRIKTYNADRTKTILTLAPLATRRRILSGTPFSKGLQDGWAQFSFLSPRILNGMNYFAFRNTFCVMGGFEGRQILTSKNEDMFTDLTAYYTGIERKADHLDLPKVYQKRLVSPTEAQAKALKELEKTGMTEVDGGVMSFTNVLVKHLRMQQAAGGFAAVEDELVRSIGDIDDFFAALERGDEAPFKRIEKCRSVPLPGGNPKIAELLNVIEETPGKLLIWCRFRPEIQAIMDALVKAYGPDSAVQFHGDCSDDERTSARRRFMNDDTCRFFVGQSRTGGIGLTLTSAQTAVYFSNDWSLETRIQSEDRNNRIGTVGTTLYIDLILDYPKSIDKRILTALQEGRSYTEDLMLQMKEASA